MNLTPRQTIVVLAVTGGYLFGQLLTGTSLKISVLLSMAICFGILAIFAGGGPKAAFGCLNTILVTKYLLVAIAVKTLAFESSDGTLHAPDTTAWVMALGFLGVFVGTFVQSRFYCPETFCMNQPFSNQMLLSLSIVLFVCSYAGYFIGLIPSASGAGIQTGGWVGISHILGSLKSLSIVPPMLFLWRMKTKLWMTHPLILALITWSAVVGIFSTGKQEAMEPLVFYTAVGFLRYGWRNVRLWSLVSVGVLYYAVIIYPYSQYVRHAGGREGSFEERMSVTKDVFLRIASNDDFRSSVTDQVSKDYYFGPSLSAFSRLAMIGEADRLIYATEQQRAFTGWETITWGFKLLMPSFLYPQKPIFEAANYLSHITGESNWADTTTQVSYGLMANFYNAFALTGVLIGTPLFFGAFYYWIRIFLGNPRWEGPTAATLWFMWVIASYQHTISEATLSGLTASISFPSVIALLYLLSKWLCLFLPPEDALQPEGSGYLVEAYQ